MSKQVIDMGGRPDNLVGDSLKEGHSKTNANFSELYDSGYEKIATTIAADDAAAGKLAEYSQLLVAVADAVSLTSPNASNVGSISLTPGDWDVEGVVTFNEGSATVTTRSACINTTTATMLADGTESHLDIRTTTTSEVNSLPVTKKRISIAVTTTVYLVGKSTFSAGTSAVYGFMTARRVR